MRHVLLCSLLLLLCACDGPVSPPTVPPADEPGPVVVIAPVQISAAPFSGIESEPTLARTAAGRVLAAFLTYPPPNVNDYPSVAVTWSNDDGATFAEPVRLDPGVVDAELLGNAAVAIDGAGRGHVIVQARRYNAAGVETGVETVVMSTAPNEDAFTVVRRPFDTAPALTFKPWVRTLNDGSVVAGTSVGPVGRTLLEAARLAADGDDFVTIDVPANADGLVGDGHVFMCPQGERGFVMVAYALNGALNAAGIYLSVTSRRSLDGLTMLPTVSRVSLDTESVIDGPIVCSTFGDNVYVSYGIGVVPANTDTLTSTTEQIVIAHSADGGTSYTERSNGQDEGSLIGALPVTAVDGNGTIHLFYIGTAAFNTSGSLFHRMSDGGVVWSEPMVVGPARINTDRITPQYIGDYFGAVANNFGADLVYTDNTASRSHVFFARITR